MKIQNPLAYLAIAIRFLKEARVEGKRVNWPTREKTVKDTIVVIIFAVIVAIFLSSFDYLFQIILNEFLL